MSYSLQLYLTNIASIEAIIDSKDQTKLSEILESDFSEDNSDGHEEFNLAVSEEIKSALESLVMGTQDRELDRTDYGYALQQIVASNRSFLKRRYLTKLDIVILNRFNMSCHW
mgnify:CR=1 FL=1